MARSNPLAVLALLLIGSAASAQHGGGVFEVDAAQSDVHWQIYSAGAFSALGHNHVISVDEMAGTVHLDGDGAPPRFEIEVPVDTLVVDDPRLRARKGEDFESEPSDSDIAGTRENMLSEQVLNAEEHPTLRVSGTLASEQLDPATLDLTVHILGMTRELAAPARIVVDGDTITAEGMLALTHEDLGMEPFSVMMGALQVAEEIDLFYRVVATRAPTAH